jgi:hypothetical protein
MTMTKRMKICLISGVLLGIVCIIGASIRSGGTASISFLFALWYNRLLMGLLIGVAWRNVQLPKALARGAFLGLVASFAFYSATGFADHVSFLAGVVYGVIMEFAVWKLNGEKMVVEENMERVHG